VGRKSDYRRGEQTAANAVEQEFAGLALGARGERGLAPRLRDDRTRANETTRMPEARIHHVASWSEMAPRDSTEPINPGARQSNKSRSAAWKIKMLLAAI